MITLGLLILVVGAAPVVTGCLSRNSLGASNNATGRPIVSKVIDGDTIEISIDGQTARVRLLGIDAPESVHPTLPVQCFGPEASKALTELLPPGTELEIRRDIQARDHFDRLLLYVYRANDGLFVNRWLIDQGLADETHYEPNVSQRNELRAAKSKARSGSVGLWGSCEGPDQPLD